jgi:mercuric ion transport protein
MCPCEEAPSKPRPPKRSVTILSVGGLSTALLASVCCIGPLVFAALGVGVGATGFLAGAAGFLKGLLPYRPAFIGLAILLLGGSFYLADRKPTSAACAPGEVCATRSGVTRAWFWVMAAFALVLILAPYWLGL